MESAFDDVTGAIGIASKIGCYDGTIRESHLSLFLEFLLYEARIRISVFWKVINLILNKMMGDF